MTTETRLQDPSSNDGWFYADDADKQLGIETKDYGNGQRMKRVTLSDGRKALCKRLKGFEIREIQRQLDGKADNYQNIIISRAITIDDKKIVPEDIDDLWLDDCQLLLSMCTVNFPSGIQNQ